MDPMATGSGGTASRAKVARYATCCENKTLGRGVDTGWRGLNISCSWVVKGVGVVRRGSGRGQAATLAIVL